MEEDRCANPVVADLGDVDVRPHTRWRALATLALGASILLLIATGASSTPTRTLGALELRATFKDAFNEETCPPRGACPRASRVFSLRRQGRRTGARQGHRDLAFDRRPDRRFVLPALQFHDGRRQGGGEGRDRRFAHRSENALLEAAASSWPDRSWPRSPAARRATREHRAICRSRENLTKESGGAGDAIETWVGTLTVPGLDFDLTPPTLHGAHDMIVRAGKARRVRVRFTVTAKDAARPRWSPSPARRAREASSSEDERR